VLVDAHWQHLSLEGLTDIEAARVRAEGDALRRRRVKAAQAQRKIGPNERCPCGSGKKYKRCCRP
jgi:preprotein translocase subunit SecA